MLRTILLPILLIVTLSACTNTKGIEKFREEVSKDKVTFEVIIKSFINERYKNSENLLLALKPLKSDTTISKKDWAVFINSNNIERNRKKVLAENEIKGYSLEEYQSCNFKSLAPPVMKEKKEEISEKCIPLIGKDLLVIQLPMKSKTGENTWGVRCFLYTNSGHEDFIFILKNNKGLWDILEKKKTGWIIS